MSPDRRTFLLAGLAFVPAACFEGSCYESNAVQKKFLDDYKTRYDQQATAYCAYGADAVFTLAAALQKAGKVDRKALRDVLATFDYTTPLGTHVKFNNPPNGENLDPTIVSVQATAHRSATRPFRASRTSSPATST